VRVFLTTERLILREFEPSDVDNLVELDSDPEVMRYLTGGRPTPRATVENELLPWLLAKYAQPGGYAQWAAIERASGAFVGWFALTRNHPDAPPDEGELGYRLGRAAWGKGYATEGARAVVRKAFEDMGTRRIWAQTMAVNTPSRRVMERTGLRFVRVFHETFDNPIEGTEHGEVEYELLREEWESFAFARRIVA
jgi:RimJ/RimL family protein N-acetyltransferase